MEGVKCAHEPCTCFVDLGEMYCSTACREDAAGDADLVSMHGSCRCKHTDCEAR